VQRTDARQLSALLNELCGAVEELLLSGLTTASKSTVERIDVSFKEASRMRLLRLGSTLRIANEEISRYTSGATSFSSRRLAFFLGRAWLLASSMRHAIDANDQIALDRLMATPATQPLPTVKLITLGVAKRVVPGAFASFDFRLRALEASATVEAGESLIWSCVFPMRKDVELPTEAFLHLPQKQKFKPSILLEKKVIAATQCAVSRQGGATTRLALGEHSSLQATESFNDWRHFWSWNPADAAARLALNKVTPLDLEIELQEEVFLDEWAPANPEAKNAAKPSEEGYDLLPIEAKHLTFEARLDHGPSGTPLSAVMKKLAVAKRRPPLYGLVHYESCEMRFQPLTALGKNGPEYLTVSPDKISQAELVKAMKFT
jgi:hypothetical protein